MPGPKPGGTTQDIIIEPGGQPGGAIMIEVAGTVCGSVLMAQHVGLMTRQNKRSVPTWRIATFWRYALKGLGPCPMDPLPYGGV